ncbi:hypothetical protein SERLA73DRAFT_150328 [Serpula lacrymans var. lacrymans S7.3]|uniref:Uncharacterized protein n=1 Tax=Serpula lacrymans var. lacrymans (strain S7.3) TaxID=936435 RepID=F8PM37_SERL3|nr:hypothetical protein SERLA73DRAFT_150328 [Serpula lacrymans var. lacrymans S7.3]
MSMAFKETKYLRLVDGSIWGLCTIDLFGLRIGRAVWDRNLRGSALIFAEREFFNNERKKKEEQKKLKGKKRKRSSLNAQGKHLAAILCKTDRAPRALVINAGATNPEGADDSTDMDLQGCRQTVFDVYFENQDADHFSQYKQQVIKPPKISKRSQLNNYSMTLGDFSLRDVLEDWREEQTRKIYGESVLVNLGPSAVMTNHILDRIIGCAHHQKIKTLQDLKKETKWMEVETLGLDVITIIQQHVQSFSPYNFHTKENYSRKCVMYGNACASRGGKENQIVDIG